MLNLFFSLGFFKGDRLGRGMERQLGRREPEGVGQRNHAPSANRYAQGGQQSRHPDPRCGAEVGQCAERARKVHRDGQEGGLQVQDARHVYAGLSSDLHGAKRL